MTVVTRKFADITKRPDYYQFEFETGLRRSNEDEDVTITPKRIKAIPEDVDGEAVLSVDLDPGPARVTYRGTTIDIIIPGTGPADLQQLIEEGVVESGQVIPSNAIGLVGRSIDAVSLDGLDLVFGIGSQEVDRVDLAPFDTHVTTIAGNAAEAAAEGAVADALAEENLLVTEELDDDEFGVRFDDGEIFFRADETNGITSKITHQPNSVPVAAADFVRDLPEESGWIWVFEGDNHQAIMGKRTDGTLYGFDQPAVVSPVLYIGDSLVASHTTIGAGLGRTVVNLGIGGQKADQIVARQGGKPTLLTVSGNAIPASGAVNVTAYSSNLMQRTGDSVSTLQGSLMGVPGTLTLTQTGGGTPAFAYTFTRTTAGSAVACPPATPFQCGQSYLDHQLIIGVGRNNVKSGDITPPADVVALVDAAIKHNRAGRLKSLVLSVPPSTADSGPMLAAVTALNDALKAAFGPQFVDTAGFLRSTDTLALVGITPTTQDEDDIADGLTPTSFTSDGLHYNTAAYSAINILLAQHYTAKGL